MFEAETLVLLGERDGQAEAQDALGAPAREKGPQSEALAFRSPAMAQRLADALSLHLLPEFNPTLRAETAGLRGWFDPSRLVPNSLFNHLPVALRDVLSARAAVLRNLEKLTKDATATHAALYAAEGSVLERLKMMTAVLSELSLLDQNVRSIAENTRDATIALEEVAFDLSRYLDKLDLDPAEAAEPAPDAAPPPDARPTLRPLPVDLEELSMVLEGDPVHGGGRIDLRTGEARKLADTNSTPNTMDLSPDGRVLYVSNRGRNGSNYYLPGPEWGSVLAIDARTLDEPRRELHVGDVARVALGDQLVDGRVVAALGVVPRHDPFAALAGLGEQAAELLVVDDRARALALHHLGQLRAGEGRVQVERVGSELRKRKGGLDEAAVVAAHDPHAVALLHAGVRQGGRERVGAAVHLAEGERAELVHDHRLIREARGERDRAGGRAAPETGEPGPGLHQLCPADRPGPPPPPPDPRPCG